MNLLPDPRSYAASDADPLARLAAAAAEAGSALQQSGPGRDLLDEVRQRVREANDQALQQALDAVGDWRARALLESAIDVALRFPENAVGVRVFAFPLLLVAGGKDAGRIAGVVPDTAALSEILQAHGAWGQSRNVGLGNVLAQCSAIERLRPSTIYAWARGDETAPPLLDVEPADILLDTADEQVHLRFLLGAAVTPRDAPDVVETASNVGAWGMGWTRALASQLAQPGLSLLPMARPPLPLRAALAAGRFAWREAQFQLFLSRELRDLRARVGEPEVAVAAFADGSVRISLATPFEATPPAQFRWPLEPGDDLEAVGSSILGLLSDCRLDRVDVLPEVQPAGAAH